MLRCTTFLLLATAIHAQTWTQATTTANPGQIRDAAMAFHAATSQALLFGGFPTLNGTWLYDGANWAPASPTATPPGRREAAMAHDLQRSRTVLFGGQGASGLLGDTWEWDGGNWIAMSPPAAPSARTGHCMAYDAIRGVTVLFGGTTNPNLPRTQADTWEWNGSTWMQVTTANAPTEAEYSSMCFDIARGVCVLAGGTSFFGAPDQSTWEYDGVNWIDRTASVGHGPTSVAGLGVANAGLVYDQVHGVSVLYGGRTPNGTFSTETWAYDGNAWSMIASGTPSSRTRFSMAFDSARGVAVLYGGLTGNFQTWFTETWEFTVGAPASYATFGGGCAGTAAVASNTATAAPRLGQPLAIQLGNLPTPGAALLLVGFSNTASAYGPLPIDLGALGAPGCFLRVAPQAQLLLLGAAGSASVTLQMPSSPGFVGLTFYTQGLVLDLPANGLGIVASDAAAAQLGS